MMFRMTFGVQRLQRPAIEVKPLFIVADLDPVLVDRLDDPVHLARPFLAVDGLRAGNEPCGVDHVSCGSRVAHASRIRQRLHQRSGTAGMIEMHVSYEYKVDVSGIQALLLERIQEQRHAVVDAGVDKCRSAAFIDQVTGIMQRSLVLGVDGRNAIVEHRGLGDDARHHSATVVSSPSRREK